MQKSAAGLQVNAQALELLELTDNQGELAVQLAREENQLNALVLQNEIHSVQAEMAELQVKLSAKPNKNKFSA